MREKVSQEHDQFSTPTSRVLKRLSKEEEEEPVTAHNLLVPYRLVYDESDLQDEVSYTTYRRMRNPKFQHLSRRTDVCDICDAGETVKSQMRRYIDANRQHLTSAHWYNANNPMFLTACLYEKMIPERVRKCMSGFLHQLMEVQHHTTSAERQRSAYRAHYTSPPAGTVVVTVDFKQKGRLPMLKQEPGKLFYSQGAFSLLGFGLHWTEDVVVRRHHVDVLLRTHNQDSMVFVRAYELVKNRLPQDRKVIFWMDSGRHFRSVLSVSRLLLDPDTQSINFFVGGHGKNDRDQHFGAISRKLEMVSKSTDILNLGQVKKAIEQIRNTTAPKLCLRSQVAEFEVLDIPNLMMISSFERDPLTGALSVHEHSGDNGFLLKKRVHVIKFKFVAKVSDKLPLGESDTDCSRCSDDIGSSASSDEQETVAEKMQKKRTKKKEMFAKMADQEIKNRARGKHPPKEKPSAKAQAKPRPKTSKSSERSSDAAPPSKRQKK
ncbi:hypothetical protein DIPPA_61256 [Diplonema papillatum]|nr:hypothetical protein DIPPA_55275 [Diplonema papillatum]KAJ9442633.1 hypothetical protein DIPPA_61256 [Diplonema papillatum]